jgi:hypothetical protein
MNDVASIAIDAGENIMINPNVAALILKIRGLEEELEVELTRQRAQFRFTLQQHNVSFEREVLHRHRLLRKGLSVYVLGARPLVVLTAPVIYTMIVPFALLDLFVTIYQAICFPVYGIRRVRRGDYLIFDRAHLGYLNGLEKLHCLFCSYANGVIAYVREIAARTEQYWCPIKHALRLRAAHDRYHKFSEFGDAENYHKELQELRKELRDSQRG